MKNFVSIFFITVACSSCTDSSGAYTLYRSSVIKENARIHVATFDSSDGPEYNRDNCEVARGLFQNQDGVKTKFWCEKGNYRK